MGRHMCKKSLSLPGPVEGLCVFETAEEKKVANWNTRSYWLLRQCMLVMLTMDSALQLDHKSQPSIHLQNVTTFERSFQMKMSSLMH